MTRTVFSQGSQSGSANVATLFAESYATMRTQVLMTPLMESTLHGRGGGEDPLLPAAGRRESTVDAVVRVPEETTASAVVGGDFPGPAGNGGSSNDSNSGRTQCANTSTSSPRYAPQKAAWNRSPELTE
jgi:hypothetical protein